MGYVDSNLMTGEQVIHRARLYWGIFVVLGILMFVGLIILIISAASGGSGGAAGSIIALLIFAIPTIRAAITYLTTELPITSRRVIVKRGLISRRTLELNHNRVEGLAVSQGIIARIFGAGNIRVNGTGGTNQNIPFISNPLEFRPNALGTGSVQPVSP